MILSLCATHKKAGVPLLESLTFKNKQDAMEKLYALDFVKECVILQTCNRVEIYVVTTEISVRDAIDQLIGFWSQNAEISRDIVFRAIELFQGRDALHHLLLLASGLESMVVGEDQILGQVRRAYVESKEIGYVKSFLEMVFMKAVNVGRRVRTETGINKGSVSISSAAIDLAEKHLGNLNSAKVLLIGAGEAGTLAGKELLGKGIMSVWVANRTYQRGVKLAKMIRGEAIRFDEIYNYLPEVDLVIAATSANEPILTREDAEGALNDWNKSSRLMVIDISQPRCIDEDVGGLSRVDLRNIDDLRVVIDENVRKRLGEAEKAKEIVLEELQHLESMLKEIVAEPIVSSLCRKAEEIRRRELFRALRMMKGINSEQRVVIENLTKVLVERILQSPIENLRLAAVNDDSILLSEVEKLFNLKTIKT